LLYLNIQDRKLPKGLYFGKDTRSTILQIDSDFAKVKHYGVETALKRIEVGTSTFRIMLYVVLFWDRN